MIGSLRIISLILALDLVSADEHSHSYNSGDEIVVWFNTVGPKNNVQETYSYSSLNLCTSKNNYNHYHESLAEALLGQDLIHSGLDIKFLKDQRKSYFCSSTFNQVQLQKLKYAVANDYWFQSYIDNLPLWGYIGFKNSTGYFIYTHRSYQFYYNNNQIIKLQMNSTGLKELSLDLKLKMNTLDIDFTYSVKWTETEELFSDRFIIVVLMRTVKRDYQRYDYNDRILDLERDFGDETGWKLVHGDVFRRPVRFSFLSAFIGTGVQLILMSFLVLMLTAAGNLYEGQATILTASIFAFAFSSVMAGYFSGRQFARHQGNNWVGTLLLTIILLPAIICIVVSVVNTVAITYSSTKAIPFGSIVKLLLIWIFLIVPLTALGFSLGKNVNSNFRFPAKANAIPRQIPDRPWYTNSNWIVVFAGILPFGAIFIELYFILSSLWSYKIYYLYGFLMLIFIILLFVTACIAIVTTYVLLNFEDHQWNWVVFNASGSVSFYVFLYSIYYYYFVTTMSGIFQFTFFFGYTFLGCVYLYLMFGSLGHLVASHLILTMYSNVKID